MESVISKHRLLTQTWPPPVLPSELHCCRPIRSVSHMATVQPCPQLKGSRQRIGVEGVQALAKSWREQLSMVSSQTRQTRAWDGTPDRLRQSSPPSIKGRSALRLQLTCRSLRVLGNLLHGDCEHYRRTKLERRLKYSRL